MKCGYTFDDINEYADGTVSEDRADIIRTHIEACKVCRQYYDSIKVSEKYIKENISMKSDIRMKVLESIDEERYKSKKIFYRFGWIRNKMGLIKKLAVAVACVFLAVLIMRNEYTGGFITSEISKILDQKQQIHTVPLDIDEGFDSPVEKGEALLYEIGSEYHLVYPDGHESKINLPGDIYSHQAFVSEDLSTIYYNTNFNGVLGRIMSYDINSAKSYDLLAEMGIELNGHIAVFSYDNDRLIAIIGSLMKDAHGNDTKLETNRLLEIDLKEKTHRFIELPFTPWNAVSGRGIDFIGDGYLISYVDILQKTVIVDKDGVIIRGISLSDPSYSVNMKVSPDDRRILYQAGQTPTDLYLYDIEKDRKITIVDSAKDYIANGKQSYCIFSAWSKSPNTLYYVVMSDSNGGKKREYSLRKYVVEEAAFDYVEDITANIPEFIDVTEAIKILKTRPVGVEPWDIEYVSEDYIYITYSFGIEFVFRYNIKENIIDRALDLRSLHKGNLTTHTSFRFLSNGLYAYFTTGNRDTGTTFQDVYKADFSNQSVMLLAETADNFWSQSFSEEYYEKEEYGKSADKYLSKVDENPKLPKLYDWSTVAQIDEDRFFVIMPNELPSPGDGYYYFKILIINVSNNEVIKEYRFSSIENVEAEDTCKKDITQILYEYAEDINMKNYSQAYEKLGTNLKNSYSGGDDKAFLNIEHMEIKRLVDKTGQQGERGQWIANPREFGYVEEYHVFYAEIEYKTNNLITSYLKDGINYQKVIIAKENSDSSWKICEMSSVRGQ